MAASRRGPVPTGRRRVAALPAFVALVVVLSILETWILLRVGHAIGGLPTVGILVAEAVLGGWLLRREGSRAWQALRGTLGSGRLPAEELTDAALVLVGGVLLMLPGFLTDVIGLVFLVPFTRPLARRVVGWFAAREVEKRGLGLDALRARAEGSRTTIDGDVVPGEVVDETMPRGGATRAPRTDEGEPPAISGTVV